MAVSYDLVLETALAPAVVLDRVREPRFSRRGAALRGPGVTVFAGPVSGHGREILRGDLGLEVAVTVSFVIDKAARGAGGRFVGEGPALAAALGLALEAEGAFLTYLHDYAVLSARGGAVVLDAGWAATRPDLADMVAARVGAVPGRAILAGEPWPRPR